MSEQNKYAINMGAKFDFLDLIKVPELIDACKEKWFNQTLSKVNDSLVRLGVFNEGEFHWHKHDNEDEFFFVVKGQLHIELEDKTLTLQTHEGITIPKGILHRPYVKEPTAVLMVEADSVTPTGD
ncbi:cupin domain-containing protein [Desulfosporosinus sp. BICA1-9]|uniref:cupin domain-containing protein n=1 Tax=Desulfosporosinus sp. BICA1-9 TaxID=1531958 RepID=UPI00061F836F|nr:cupin domain-containing protein [Desulfosporosinus sp. BICA1-9]KJS50828.1 MAG: cupin [Peptococcaceae bacterium BRH_c23]HBW37378.1 cupin domain-containing protein [Desulfosporosinus sp.]